MATSFSLEKILRRIDDKLSQIAINTHQLANGLKPNEVQKPEKETWVTVGIIQTLTGWKKYELKQARANGLVKTKTEGVSLLYLLESLNPKFIIIR